MSGNGRYKYQERGSDYGERGTGNRSLGTKNRLKTPTFIDESEHSQKRT